MESVEGAEIKPDAARLLPTRFSFQLVRSLTAHLDSGCACGAWDVCACPCVRREFTGCCVHRRTQWLQCTYLYSVQRLLQPLAQLPAQMRDKIRVGQGPEKGRGPTRVVVPVQEQEQVRLVLVLVLALALALPARAALDLALAPTQARAAVVPLDFACNPG